MLRRLGTVLSMANTEWKSIKKKVGANSLYSWMKLTDSQYKLFELGHFLLRVYY